jgi:Flp pilus assembly pilin Flp
MLRARGTKVQDRTRPPHGHLGLLLPYRGAMNRARTWLLDDVGQTAVEYATVVALAAIVIALALAVIPQDAFDSFWTTVHDALQ